MRWACRLFKAEYWALSNVGADGVGVGRRAKDRWSLGIRHTGIFAVIIQDLVEELDRRHR